MAQYLPSMFKALGSYTVPPKNKTNIFVVLCVHLYTLCMLCGITVITIIQNTHVTDKNIFYKKFQKGRKQPESRLMTMCEVTDHLGDRNSFPAYEKVVLWPVQATGS